MEQQNKYRVIVSARTAQMLVSHAAFLAQVSPAAAERLTVEFEKAAKSLEQMPQRCPWLKGEYIPKNAYRFILFEKRYMLIFQIVDNTVYADYVVDCRQDYGGSSDNQQRRWLPYCGRPPHNMRRYGISNPFAVDYSIHRKNWNEVCKWCTRSFFKNLLCQL